MSLPDSESGFLHCVAFDPRGRWLIAGGGGLSRRDKRSVTLRELIAWNLPALDVHKHVVSESKEAITDLAVHPDGTEIATKWTGGITIWSPDFEPLRTIATDFLGGPITYSPDGTRLVAPNGQELKVHDSRTGEVVASVPIGNNMYTAAKAAAFVGGSSRLLVGAQVINSRGQISGELLLVESAPSGVLKTVPLDFSPECVTVDPQGRWACIAGERKSRGYVLFWDLAGWRAIAQQGAHGASIGSLAIAPSGEQIASTGSDHVVRIWDLATGKTVSKLESETESTSSASVAWSPDGNSLALVCGGRPPYGGVFLWQRSGGAWQLFSESLPPAAAASSAEQPIDLRHIEDFSESQMDTIGNCDLSANVWPVKCPHCTLPDLDAVPEPYLLSRGVSAPGDLAAAQMGNFLVRERAREVLETTVPGACKFYPTYHAKTRQPTDWFLAVPQVTVLTATLPTSYKKCSVCGEPKVMDRHECERPAFASPSVDIFKSRQWTCWRIGEETPWYLKDHLKVSPDQVRKEQWTRLKLERELWLSTRLLLLMRHLKLKGLEAIGGLERRKPTPEEAAWIVANLEKLAEPEKVKPAKASVDSNAWLRSYLEQHAASKPIATPKTIASWERKHQIKLPPQYVEFVTTVGRHKFCDMFGRDGYDVRLVGLRDLDATEYRRDPPKDPADEAEPDGLLFAVAVNGDGLCFDLRGPADNYPVYHFDHETEQFEPFAADFAGAVQRLAEQE